MVSTPHFRHPFRFGKNGVTVVEQDSSDELFGCAKVALLYERGTRIGISDFGLPDQAMLLNGANFRSIVAAVTEHDERLAASAERDKIIQQGIDHVRIVLGIKSDG